ncbi:MAG: diguanylate cyclase [Leptospiraceae bacterium]|nr:diguanylate cyclase [Leptospiraceae bacterium]MCP5493268.1 diguanylate cyclase [Leptospiraceae bacterium]
MQRLDIHLLYVEDDFLIRESTYKVLKRFVSRVSTASNGEEAFSLFSKDKPDVILTDISMPRIDGLALAKKIIETDQDVPIIINSAHSDAFYFLKAISTKVEGFLIKPIDFNLLYELLKKVTRELILKKEVQKQINRIKTLLDFLANMVIMTDGFKLYEVNKSFLEFTGYLSIEEFHQKYKKISDIFIQEKGYVYDLPDKTWVSVILNNSINQNRVKLYDSIQKEEKVFLLKYNKVLDDDVFIVSFTDITDLDRKTIRLEHTAFIDDLTKIYNRRKFDELFLEELQETEKSQSKLSLIMFDLDFFKNINDTYGHREGDIVLQKLTKEVGYRIRQSDVFARWGGEEFMILLKNTGINGAYHLAEKIRKFVEKIKFNFDKKVTISLGITEYRQEDTIEAMVERADEALYRAKENGRNRTENF